MVHNYERRDIMSKVNSTRRHLKRKCDDTVEDEIITIVLLWIATPVLCVCFVYFRG